MKRTILFCLLLAHYSLSAESPKHFSCQYLKHHKADNKFKSILDFFLTPPFGVDAGTKEIVKNTGTEEIHLTVPEQGALILKITPNDKKNVPQIHFINVDWQKDTDITLEIPESSGSSKPYLKLACSTDLKK
jgi:hypothetical protein